MSLPTNLYNLETPLDQTHGANLMFNFSHKFLHPQFPNALSSDPRTFQNSNPSLYNLMGIYNQGPPPMGMDDYNSKMEELARQYYMEQNLKQQQEFYQDMASLASLESQLQAQKNGMRMPNGFPPPQQQQNVKSAENPMTSKKMENAKEVNGANQGKSNRVLPQGNKQDAIDFPLEESLHSLQSNFLNRNNNLEKISLDQIASQAQKNSNEKLNNLMLMNMLNNNPMQQEAFQFSAANLSLENQVYQQQLQAQMMLQTLPPELRNFNNMQALYQMDPNNALMMQNARLYQQLNQESKNLEAFAQGVNAQLQAQAALLFGKELPQQNLEELIMIGDSPTKNLSMNMMQGLGEKNDRSAVMQMMMNYPLSQPANNGEKTMNQQPLMGKFHKDSPVVVQDPRKRPFEEIEQHPHAFEAADKIIRLSTDKTIRVNVTESNKPLKKEKKIAIKKPEKSEKPQVQKKSKPEITVPIATTTTAKQPEQLKPKNELLANMMVKKPQQLQSPKQKPEVHRKESIEENSFGYHLHERFDPMYYEQQLQGLSDGNMIQPQNFPYQIFPNNEYDRESENEQDNGVYEQYEIPGHGQQLPVGFYNDEVQFENLFPENYAAQPEITGLMDNPAQKKKEKEKEKTSAKKIPQKPIAMAPPISIEEPLKRVRGMNKLQMIKFAYETYQDELKKPYVIDLHTNPNNPDQRIVPTKVGQDFQVDLNRFNPIHRVRVTQRRLQPLWNPDLAPAQLDEYCYRFEQIIGHRVTNQEMMIKQLIKCDMDIPRALEDTKKHQLFYKNSLRLDQRVLRTRGSGK